MYYNPGVIPPAIDICICIWIWICTCTRTCVCICNCTNAMALRPDLALSSEPFPEHDGTTRPDLAHSIR